MRRLLACAAVVLSGCGGAGDQTNQNIVAAVRAQAGEAPELEFSAPNWCSETVDGKRAAMVAAVGPVQSGLNSGAGGYLVEVSEDGTVLEVAKGSPPDPSSAPSGAARRIDSTYCGGKLVVAPYEAIEELRRMSAGQYR